MHPQPEVLYCRCCGATKPKEEMAGHTYKGEWRYSSRCKHCYNQSALPLPQQSEHIYCKHCQQWKPATETLWEIYKGARAPRGICLTCNRLRAQHHYTYTPKPKRCSECGQVKPASEMARGHTFCRECGQGHDRKEQYRAARHRRRAWRKANGGSYTVPEWVALKARYDNRCLRCGKQEPETTLTVDHVVALSRGGTNNIDNLQPLCKSCNSSKRAKGTDYR